MAKSTHSNSKKKLRTQRREQVVKQTSWLTTADERRQTALAACVASEPVESHTAPSTDKEDAMETSDKPATARVKKAVKSLKGAVMKKGRKKKISVLAVASQFYKKGKKGSKRRR